MSASITGCESDVLTIALAYIQLDDDVEAQMHERQIGGYKLQSSPFCCINYVKLYVEYPQWSS